MKKFRTKKILSVICLMALILSFNLNAAALASEVKDEKKTTVDENQEVKPTDDKKPEVKPTDEEKPEVKPETKPTDDKKPEVKPEVKPTDDKKPEVKPEVEKDKAKLSTVERVLWIEIMARDSNGVERLHSEFSKLVEDSSMVSIPISNIYKDIIEVKGGDFEIINGNLVGYVDKDVNVQVIIKLDNFERGDVETRVIFVDENGKAIKNAPYQGFIKLYEKPGTISSYKPPQTLPGYKLIGPAEIKIPENTGTTPLTVKIAYQAIELTHTMSFVDEAGNKLQPDVTKVGKIGESVVFNIGIKGYTALGVNNSDFTFRKGRTTYTHIFDVPEYDELNTTQIVYRKDKVVTAEKTNVVKPTKTLPKTGINRNYAAAVGITLLAIGIFIAFKKEKEY